MITPFEIYLANQVDSFIQALAAACFISVFSIGICLLIMFARVAEDYPTNDPFFKKLKKTLICVIIIFCSSGVLIMFIPNTKTVYEMMIIPRIVNNPYLNDLPNQLLKYVDTFLGKYNK